MSEAQRLGGAPMVPVFAISIKFDPNAGAFEIGGNADKVTMVGLPEIAKSNILNPAKPTEQKLVQPVSLLPRG